MTHGGKDLLVLRFGPSINSTVCNGKYGIYNLEKMNQRKMKIKVRERLLKHKKALNVYCRI